MMHGNCISSWRGLEMLFILVDGQCRFDSGQVDLRLLFTRPTDEEKQ